MAFKIAFSKSGFNVLTETNPNNLTFSTDYKTLKYATSGTMSLSYIHNNPTQGTSQWSISVSFSFAYKPVIFVFIDIDSSNVYYPTAYYTKTISNVQDFHAYYDGNTLTFYIRDYANGGTGVNKTAKLRYFIFKNNTGL